jgi:hypothetical protein
MIKSPPCHYCQQPSLVQIIDSFDEPPEALCRQCLEDTRPDYFQRHQAHRREELLDKIIKIHHFDDTKLVIEFQDVAIAYEKKLDVLKETRPNLGKDIIVPQPGAKPYIISQPLSFKKEYNIPIIRCGYKSDVNFSEEMRKIFKTIEGETSKKLQEAKERVRKLYSKVSTRLGIKAYTFRDWSAVSALAPFALLWPVYPIYQLYITPINRDYSLLLAPCFFFLELIVALTKTEKAYKITDLSQLHIKKTEEAAVGLYFEPKSGSFERFKDFYLQFPDGITLTKDSIHSMDLEFQDYEPIFYLKVEKNLKDDLKTYLSLEKKILNNNTNFEKNLTQEDHLELLRHCKFI